MNLADVPKGTKYYQRSTDLFLREQEDVLQFYDKSSHKWARHTNQSTGFIKGDDFITFPLNGQVFEIDYYPSANHLDPEKVVTLIQEASPHHDFCIFGMGKNQKALPKSLVRIRKRVKMSEWTLCVAAALPELQLRLEDLNAIYKSGFGRLPE